MLNLELKSRGSESCAKLELIHDGCETMAVQSTEYKYIILDDDRIPYIAGSTMKVVELVTSHLTYGWSPEELHFQYPHISLSQIHSALAYYWDHKSELDTDIQRRLEFAMQQKSAATSTIAAKLRPTKSL